MRHIVSFLSVVVLAVMVLTACNSAENSPRSSTGAPGSVPAATAPPASDGVRRVTVAELKEMLARNEVMVIDVRNQASFDAGHIRGARLIPEAEVVSHSAELPKDKVIVTYCS